MSDITKCPGRGCTAKEQCYRYTAPENPYWQSQANYHLENQGYGACRHFLPNSVIKTPEAA